MAKYTKYLIIIFSRILLVTSQVFVLILYSNSLSTTDLSKYNSLMVFAIFFITLIFHPIDIDLQKKLYDKKNKYFITKIYKNAQLLLLIIVVISIIGVHCFKTNNFTLLLFSLVLSSFMVQSIQTAIMNAHSHEKYNLIIYIHAHL